MGVNRSTSVADDCVQVAYRGVDVLTTRYGTQTFHDTELRGLELAVEDVKDWKQLWA